MEEEDRHSEILEISEASCNGKHSLNFPIYAFGFGIGLFAPERITDSIDMFFKGVGDLDGLFNACLSDTGEPELEIGHGFGGGGASEDRLEVLALLPEYADLEIRVHDRLENLFLLLGAVFWIGSSLFLVEWIVFGRFRDTDSDLRDRSKWR